MIQRLAPAKINLDLAIVGKRTDGYHLLDSQVVFAEFGDILGFQLAEDISLKTEGSFAQDAGQGDNLILHAAELLRKTCRINKGAAITLDKRIPVGAGLGGGSSDAAVTLKTLNALWDCKLDTETLCRIGVTLGADIPVCIHARPLRMQGIGEKVTLTSFPEVPPYCLLVKPKASLATKEIYAHVRFDTEDANQLQPAAVALCPEIAEVITALTEQEGCGLARMTGSGSACFGLFSDAEAVSVAQKTIARTHPEWWVQPTLLQH
ncbi:MAG: 4-(cytidine 5'-diphospho)-2-C-methyl-D-erythritol kinase [Rickettsiales bacterium]|nr:4-(cytidine 5'-diphospho)-2-C-methyl-D-erythritol kinase [Rickettsiales bacterium]